MSPNVKEISEQAMQCTRKERAALAQQLLQSLDEEEWAETEEYWLEEVKRRWEEYEAGRIATIPAEEVFEKMKANSK